MTWSIEVNETKVTFICYRPVDGVKSYRIIELHDGPPSLGDIECIQNYLESYKGAPVDKVMRTLK
jgi:hypothetical protein